MAAKKKTTKSSRNTSTTKSTTKSAFRLGEVVGRAIGEAAVTVIKETKEPKKTEKRVSTTKKSSQKTPPSQVQNTEQQYYPCPRCGQPLAYIVQYKEWYCYQCKAYASELVRGKEEVPPPPPGTYIVSDQ